LCHAPAQTHVLLEATILSFHKNHGSEALGRDILNGCLVWWWEHKYHVPMLNCRDFYEV